MDGAHVSRKSQEIQALPLACLHGVNTTCCHIGCRALTGGYNNIIINPICKAPRQAAGY